MAATAAMLTVATKAQTEGSITFVVDEDVTPTEGRFRYLNNGERTARFILNEESIPSDAHNIVATSFDDAQNMRLSTKDAFYQCIVDAYANHLSVTLSPDMIWLLICQGFARYVNAHAEEVRPMLVSHKDKMDLVIETRQDLLSGNADWPELIGTFASQIDRHTKGDIAKTITANFTTTGITERVASQITLMESVKAYFEYVVMRVACGIPSITLKGTPDDWQQLMEKTRRLKSYGLEEWTESLEPILAEFVRAAKGKPRQRFWQDIVKKRRVNKLKGGGCSGDKPTELDGWLLTFFPDENGKTLDRVPKTKSMPSERVRVGFRYRIIDPAEGTVISEVPLELWAGFIGAEEDTLTNTLTPRIGWLVRKAQSDDDVLDDLKKNDEEWGIDLRIKEVPDILARLEHIRSLSLHFTDEVVIPQWFYSLTIDNLTIYGETTREVEAKILKHFPNARLR